MKNNENEKIYISGVDALLMKIIQPLSKNKYRILQDRKNKKFYIKFFKKK